MQELPPNILIDIIEKKRYGVEYQPIISLSNNEIYAYEALSRFYNKSKNTIAPDIVFASLHQSPLSLFQVEYQQKCVQLSHAPNNEKIFINLDQDSYFASGISNGDNPFMKIFTQHKKNNVTIELIENSHINDAKMSLAMIKVLLSNHIKSAIDDVFAPLSMLSFEVVQFVDYIKLDKSVIPRQNDPTFIMLIQAIIHYAHNTNKKIILEGVETLEDLEFANTLGADFVQGFLFRDKFINHSI